MAILLGGTVTERIIARTNAAYQLQAPGCGHFLQYAYSSSERIPVAPGIGEAEQREMRCRRTLRQKRSAESEGLISPLKTSFDNHKGETIAAKIIQWNGQSWDTRTDRIKADASLFADVIKAKAGRLRQGKRHPASRCNELNTPTDRIDL
ncbi:MAG: hypothetical protein E5X37_10270 [Mesorhizobium sp.]|uniref:hypothetical protein n=1 Tax=Mesorhizobium sp. TaxID=1871066 RepID=UPI00120B42B7|nr:hypothetical protein [Mesorhizobium sp.]TIR12131.1 MAG: hypothetical protein E5X37_10270 [Mesorhizobium sp.]